MPYKMSWYVTKRVAYEKLSGHVTIDEIRELLRDGEKFQAEAGEQALHFIADITDLHSLPMNIVKLRKLELKQPRTRGMTVVVSSPNYSVNSVATFFGKLMRTVFGLRFRMLESQEEAYAHLQLIDPTLAGIEPGAEQKTDQTVTDTQPVSEAENADTQPLKTVAAKNGKKRHS